MVILLCHLSIEEIFYMSTQEMGDKKERVSKETIKWVKGYVYI